MDIQRRDVCRSIVSIAALTWLPRPGRAASAAVVTVWKDVACGCCHLWIEHLKAQPRATSVHNTSMLAYVPIATNAVYSASKAALHSYALSQRFMLKGTGVTVQEIAPPWVDTDLIKKSGDPRAMPLDTFIAETMKGLATDAPEVFVEAIRALRDNPGSGEHAMVDGFNAEIAANPIPV